jgi:hypothetical protein
MKKLMMVSSLLLPTIAVTLFTPAIFALEVDREVMPRIQLGGRIMSSVDAVDLDSDSDQESNLSLSDSSLLVRFDKRMYSDGVAGATVGFTENEDAVVFHQLNGFYWNRDFAVNIGRSRMRNTLLELPLMRDDDLLDYTHVGNASSNEEFDQIYGKQLSFDLFIDRKIQRVGLWTGTRRNSIAGAADGFDSAGFGYVYEQPEDLRYVKRVRHAGVLVDAQEIEMPSGSDWSYALIAGSEVNLNIDPRSNWSLAGQAIFNQGVSGIAAADVVHGAVNAVASRAASESTSVVVSLRHTGRPKLLTRYQAGLSFAYKDYADINNGSQWSVVSNAFYKLGQGVDLLAQLKYTDYGDGLGGGNDAVVQVGMVFSFDAMFNDTIGERDSILNLEHGYIQ